MRGSLGVPSHGVQVAGQARVFDEKESITMARSNKTLVPEAKQALNQCKMEAANEVGVTLNQGYNGQLTSAQAGSIGGQMVKKMIQSYENGLAGKNQNQYALPYLQAPAAAGACFDWGRVEFR